MLKSAYKMTANATLRHDGNATAILQPVQMTKNHTNKTDKEQLFDITMSSGSGAAFMQRRSSPIHPTKGRKLLTDVGAPSSTVAIGYCEEHAIGA